METPDPPNDTPGASKQVVLTPHDIPRILRAGFQRGPQKNKCHQVIQTPSDLFDPKLEGHWSGQFCEFRDLFGMVSSRDPFKWLSDLQLRDEKVTLNHLGINRFLYIFKGSLNPLTIPKRGHELAELQGKSSNTTLVG